MPVGQRPPLLAQAVGAALRQPFDIGDLALGQRQTVGDVAAAVLVIAAARGRKVEQPARDIGGIDAPGILILQLVQAAFAAPVAQRLPLPRVQAGERGLTKGPRASFPPFASSAAHLSAAPSSMSAEASSSRSNTIRLTL